MEEFVIWLVLLRDAGGGAVWEEADVGSYQDEEDEST